MTGDIVIVRDLMVGLGEAPNANVAACDCISGRARWTAHTAFHDPTSAPDARPRESIEIRTLAFF